MTKVGKAFLVQRLAFGRHALDVRGRDAPGLLVQPTQRIGIPDHNPRQVRLERHSATEQVLDRVPDAARWRDLSTETWANESSIEFAKDWLSERYPGETVEIIEPFNVGYVGWVADYQGALNTHNHEPELVIVGATSAVTENLQTHIHERLAEYQRLTTNTERVLARYMDLVLAQLYVEVDALEGTDDKQN